MKIKIMYENKAIYLEIPNDGDYSLMLDIDYEMRLSEEKNEVKKKNIKRCKTVQEVVDIMNKQEYNNWHKFNRHRGEVKNNYISDDDENYDNNPMDKFADWSDIEKSNAKDDYEELSKLIYKALKPDYAKMIIKIHLDGMTVQEYAALIDDKPNNVSHRLKRAEKKLKNYLIKTSFFNHS